jgi:hypothetical protein
VVVAALRHARVVAVAAARAPAPTTARAAAGAETRKRGANPPRLFERNRCACPRATMAR